MLLTVFICWSKGFGPWCLKFLKEVSEGNFASHFFKGRFLLFLWMLHRKCFFDGNLDFNLVFPRMLPLS